MCLKRTETILFSRIKQYIKHNKYILVSSEFYEYMQNANITVMNNPDKFFSIEKTFILSLV